MNEYNPKDQFLTVWLDWAFFEKFWWNIFSPQLPKFYWLSGLLWKTSLLCKSYFWATYGKVWASFYFNIWSHWPATRRYNLERDLNWMLGANFFIVLIGYYWTCSLWMLQNNTNMFLLTWILCSVTRKKSPNVCKSCLKMISLQKW